VTVQLLPNYHRGSDLVGNPLWDAEPLTDGPAYVRSRNASRWHRPRSGCRWPDGRVIYNYWCGSNFGTLGIEEIPPGDALCGTCEGRFAAQDPGSTWTFTPMSHLPPALCPASRSGMWFPTGYRWGPFSCLVCGEPVKARSVSRYYSGAAVSVHKPGPGLVEPCPKHGWYSIVRVGDQPVCRCQVPRGAP
jgi:hypothetical protein